MWHMERTVESSGSGGREYEMPSGFRVFLARGDKVETARLKRQAELAREERQRRLKKAGLTGRGFFRR